MPTTVVQMYHKHVTNVHLDNKIKTMISNKHVKIVQKEPTPTHTTQSINLPVNHVMAYHTTKTKQVKHHVNPSPHALTVITSPKTRQAPKTVFAHHAPLEPTQAAKIPISVKLVAPINTNPPPVNRPASPHLLVQRVKV